MDRFSLQSSSMMEVFVGKNVVRRVRLVQQGPYTCRCGMSWRPWLALPATLQEALRSRQFPHTTTCRLNKKRRNRRRRPRRRNGMPR